MTLKSEIPACRQARRNPKSEGTGFTLIELIIVIVVVGICFIPVMGLFTESLYNNVKSEAMTVATFLAEGKMEEVIQAGFLNISKEEDSFNSPFDSYSYEIDYNYVEPWNLNTSVTGPTEYKKITVTVSHTLINDVILTCLLSDYKNEE